MLHRHKGVGPEECFSNVLGWLDSGESTAGDGAAERPIVVEFGDCIDSIDG